jgi:DNA primase
MNHINLQDLKQKVDVANLLTHYEFKKIEDKGDWILAMCPFHQDSNPSFNMRKGDTYFHCWACKTNGDAIKLVMDLEHLEFTEAINKLAGLTGYIINDDSRLEYLKAKWMSNPKKEEAIEKVFVPSKRILELNWWAKHFFEEDLRGSIAHEYLETRGFGLDEAQAFDLGYYSPKASFIEEAKHLGYSDTELTVAGFLTSYGERFVDRLMFPIYDFDHNVVAFSGRALIEGQEPKYTATPNSDFYKKGLYLYGLNRVQNLDDIILVEGNLDCVRMSNNGFNVLAQLGSALTIDQCKLLRTLDATVVLLYDGDSTGRAISSSNILPLIEQWVYVEVATLPMGYDPDTFIKNFGVAPMKELIEQKVNGIKYYFEQQLLLGKQPECILSNCLRAVHLIKDELVQDLYIVHMGETFGLSEKSLRIEIKK